MRDGLDEAGVEVIYDALAQAVDSVPAADESAFLARLCLLLCHRLGDVAVVRACIADALADAPDPATAERDGT